MDTINNAGAVVVLTGALVYTIKILLPMVRKNGGPPKTTDAGCCFHEHWAIVENTMDRLGEIQDRQTLILERMAIELHDTHQAVGRMEKSR